MATVAWGASGNCDAVAAGVGDRALACVEAGCRKPRAVLHPTPRSNGIVVTRAGDFLAFLELCFDEDH